MISLNRTTLIGRVGQKPKITIFTDGDKSAQFSLATSISRKGVNGNWEQEMEWHNIAVYGKPVDGVEKYVNKGDLCFVEGRNRTRTYVKDDMNIPVHEVLVSGYEGSVRVIVSKAPPSPPEGGGVALPS